jgi:hypothetical protein
MFSLYLFSAYNFHAYPPMRPSNPDPAGAAGSSNNAEQPKHEHDHHNASQRNRKVHSGLLRPCWLDLGLVQRNAVKGEWKDRRLGWINSDSISYVDPDSFTLHWA